MRITAAADKEKFMPLLLIGDEQEDMIRRYLDRSEVWLLSEGESVRALCAVTDEGGGVLELRNIAVYPEYQCRGYGREMIKFVSRHYSGKFSRLRAGTGDSPLTVPFYEKCGFERVRTVKNWFTENYSHPIYECGVQLRDMLIFEKDLEV